MAKAFLPHYKKRFRNFEEGEDFMGGNQKADGQISSRTPLTQADSTRLPLYHARSTSYLPPTPPSPRRNSPLPPPNPLSQFADISLAIQGLLPPVFPPLQTLPQDFHASLARFFLPTFLKQRAAELSQHALVDSLQKQLTPSSSPSPPPAHSSPVKSNLFAQAAASHFAIKERQQLSYISDDHVHRLIRPVQSDPEDLRVVARKLDFPPVKTAGSSSEEEEEGSYADSTCEHSSFDGGNYLHGKEGFHPCPDCGKAYSTSSNLARHRQTHRSLHDKKARKCPHCDKAYVSMPAYSMHIRTHNLGCKCPFCGKCFSRPWLLQGHIRTHTGEKPFSCNICEKSFADKSNLRAHTQTHSNAKPYVCKKCKKAFALKSYLYKHEESSCLRGFKLGLKEERRRVRSFSTDQQAHLPIPSIPNLADHYNNSC